MNPFPREARAVIARGGTRSPPDPALAAPDPSAEAMRHRRRGVWLSWSRAAVSARVERLAAGLRVRGLGAGSAVVVSGDYTPSLVLFVAAATRLGAAVIPLPPGIARPELAAWLGGHAPALVFLGGRDALGVWGAALQQAERSSDIVVDVHLPWGQPVGADFAFAAELLGDLETDAVLARPDRNVLWIEEGTEWTEGLPYILRAAAEGRSLAFPESRAAAHRDRAAIQPGAIAISPDRHAALVGDLAGRLPAGGTIAARLTRWALGAGRAGRERWYHRPVLHSLRRAFGLAGLRHLVVVGPRRGASPGAAGDLLTSLGIVAGYAVVPADAAHPAPAQLAFA